MPRAAVTLNTQLLLLPRSNGWAPFSTHTAFQDGQAIFHILLFLTLSTLSSDSHDIVGCCYCCCCTYAVPLCPAPKATLSLTRNQFLHIWCSPPPFAKSFFLQ